MDNKKYLRENGIGTPLKNNQFLLKFLSPKNFLLFHILP